LNSASNLPINSPKFSQNWQIDVITKSGSGRSGLPPDVKYRLEDQDLILNLMPSAPLCRPMWETILKIRADPETWFHPLRLCRPMWNTVLKIKTWSWIWFHSLRLCRPMWGEAPPRRWLKALDWATPLVRALPPGFGP